MVSSKYVGLAVIVIALSALAKLMSRRGQLPAFDGDDTLCLGLGEALGVGPRSAEAKLGVRSCFFGRS